MNCLSYRLLPKIVLLICLGLILQSSRLSGAIDKLSPSLLGAHAVGSRVKVVAFLNPSTNTGFRKSLLAPGSVRTRENHASLIRELRNYSNESTSFVDHLNALADSGVVEGITRFWITDAVAFTVDSRFLERISDYPELHYLVADQQLQLVDPVSVDESSSDMSGSQNYMEVTGVRAMWNKGYTGRGRLVCGFDTGVEETHPALSGRWLGANGGSPAQSWFDPYGSTAPVDGNGHGTHTMGIMVGRDGSDTIGVAFNASWIAAAVVDRGQTLGKTVSDILAAFQWAADPDGNPETTDDLPDVVSNSWGIPRGLFPPCDETFYQAIDNLEALGVVVVFACGNEGPNPGTIRNPADRTSSPTNSFSIGAVDQNQVDLPVATFSSRGPATCDTSKIKPEIMAPGVAIRSSFRGGIYKSMSGTSMAAPFVAGCIALMREYNPDATVEQIKNALINSARDLGAVGKDNDYGWGFINVAHAIEYLPKPNKPRLALNELQLAQSAGGIFAQGATTALEISLTDSVGSCGDLSGEIRCSDGHVYALVDTASFAAVSVGGSTSNVGRPFLIKVDHEIAPGTTVGFTVDFFSKQLGYLNSVDFNLIVDQPVIAATAKLHTSRLDFETTNFGVSRRMYDAAAGYNPLTQLSFMIADSLGAVYDALPGNSDYFASEPLASESFAGGSAVTSHFRTTDEVFSVSEKASVYDSPTEANFVLLNYRLEEGMAASFKRCYLALGIDVDFIDGETVLSDGSDFIFRNGSYDRFIGIRVLPRGRAYGQELPGNSFKNGSLDDPQKFGLVSAGATSLSGSIGDNALVVGVGPTEIATTGGAEMTVVIASGNSLDEIRLALQRGEYRNNQATGADDGGGANLPQSFRLNQNFPNPFNAETAISFSLPTGGDCRFEIIDVLGRVVKNMELTGLRAGTQTVTWDATDEHGNVVASGVYFYRVSFNGGAETRKMLLLK
jgi:subtilisin family serine protease